MSGNNLRNRLSQPQAFIALIVCGMLFSAFSPARCFAAESAAINTKSELSGLSPADSAYVTLGLRLVGVINFDNEPKAWVSMNGLDEEVLIGEGDLLGGYTVARIDSGQIELENGSDCRILALRHLKVVRADAAVKVYAADFEGANSERPRAEAVEEPAVAPPVKKVVAKAARLSNFAKSRMPSIAKSSDEPSAPKSEVKLASSGSRPEFLHPMRGTGRVSSPFGYRERPRSRSGHYGSRYHKGIDVAAPHSTTVYASAAGEVAASGYSWDRGRYLVIRHAGGYETCYYHLYSRSVTKGQYVKAGQVIGQEGTTGSTSTGPHLHFEIHKNGVPRDPASYVKF